MSEQKTVALVTGAYSALGAEFCRQLARRCEVIIAVARRGERLRALRDELASACELHPVAADLLTVEGVAHCMEMLRQKGPVDILVNNAGCSPCGEFAGQPVGGQRDMLSLHCDASITLCRAAIPFMLERGGGSNVNVSSIAAFSPARGLAVYGASKALLIYFSRALAAELAASGVEVQALCPGLVRTEVHAPMAARDFDPASFPGQVWMEARDVVAASLDALGSGRVLVVPGEGNLALARAGVEDLLGALGG